MFMDIFGVIVVWLMFVMGYYDEFVGYVEVEFNNVCVLVDNLLLGEGRGFEIV